MTMESEEEAAYWAELQERVDGAGIQWVGEATAEPEEILEVPESPPTRLRDTSLGIQSPSKRRRDRHLPRRRGLP